MATTGKKLDYNDFKETPKSKMSKQVSITKPEVRDVGPHTYGVSQAEKMIAKMGSGK